MARNNKELGGRKHARVELRKPAYLILAPDAPWIECQIINISASGVCLDIGALAVPALFGLSLTEDGQVLRVCSRIWRRGQVLGARFTSAQELRNAAEDDQHRSRSRRQADHGPVSPVAANQVSG